MAVRLVEVLLLLLIFYLQTTVSCFLKPNLEEARSIRDILKSYEVQSGQAVNFQKSAIFSVQM